MVFVTRNTTFELTYRNSLSRIVQRLVMMIPGDRAILVGWFGFLGSESESGLRFRMDKIWRFCGVTSLKWTLSILSTKSQALVRLSPSRNEIFSFQCDHGSILLFLELQFNTFCTTKMRFEN